MKSLLIVLLLIGFESNVIADDVSVTKTAQIKAKPVKKKHKKYTSTKIPK